MRNTHDRSVAWLTAAVSASVSGAPVGVVEPDERLFPLIRRQVEVNGGTVSFEHGAILDFTEPRRSVEFYLHDEIWFSPMHASVDAHGDRPRTRIEVPGLALVRDSSRTVRRVLPECPTVRLDRLLSGPTEVLEQAHRIWPGRICPER